MLNTERLFESTVLSQTRTQQKALHLRIQLNLMRERGQAQTLLSETSKNWSHHTENQETTRQIFFVRAIASLKLFLHN